MFGRSSDVISQTIKMGLVRLLSERAVIAKAMPSIGSEINKMISRVDPTRRPGDDDEPIVKGANSVLTFLQNIRKQPVPLQIGVGGSAGVLTGYVFTKGSKLTAGFIGCSLIIFQTVWERAAEILAAARPYLRYLLLPAGVYALNRLIPVLIPGPQHQSKLVLRDRTVLITGASSGLGRELAIKFYREGAKLILTARSIDKLKGLCDELKAMPDVENRNDPVYKYLDMCDPNGFEEIIALAPSRKIDVLVNNAGLSMRGSCKDTPIKVYKQLMEVNYFGHVVVTKALLDYIPDDGAIVVTSSVQGRIAVPYRSAYSASKHAAQLMEVNYFGHVVVTKALLDYIPDDGAIVVTSSVQGRIAVPYRSAYSASKHAAQAFFDSLRCEDRPGLQILVVSAGYMNTGFGRHALNTQGEPMNKDDEDQAKGLSPIKAAELIYRALVNRQTELILAPLHHRIGIFLRWFSPNLFFWLNYRRSLKDQHAKHD
ncbi:Dehydrogenase/reductase SDR family member 7B [Toxocara canis]|uniref:Dehydrogenase/reductase SDR family member 7B n=1 Tax=Toxocara canis TaxID=6265 RepID=A0A0B2UYN9_TOXCA|nr:Dehydrogenase/reductase SDR family member 7B [Toxocara canis]